MLNNYNMLVANDYSPIQFIAGSDQTLTFTILDSGSVPVDLAACTCEWYMCPYGYPNQISASAIGVVDSGSTNIFSVELPPSATSGVSGVFQQQIVITDFLGVVYKPSQGLITILPAIG